MAKRRKSNKEPIGDKAQRSSEMTMPNDKEKSKEEVKEVPEEVVEEIREPVATEVSQEPPATQVEPLTKGTIVQQLMSHPRFRKLVISRLIKKLRSEGI